MNSPSPAALDADARHRLAVKGGWLIALATLLFSAMGVCVKLASDQYSAYELVFYRGLVGTLAIGIVSLAHGSPLKTPVPAMHLWRSVVGVASLGLWFYAIGGMPLATAMTLNYMSSVWMGVFLLAGSVLFGRSRVDGRLVVTLLVGFAGVAMILRPTLEQNQLWHGLMGLLSGILAALAYLQVGALGRVGEPDYRVVFYFSMGSVVAGAACATATGWHGHSLRGLGLLAGVGLFATGAQMLLTRAYAIGKPLVNASLQYLGIVYAFVFGVLLFDDPVTWLALGGMVLIIGAGLAATLLRARNPSLPAASTFNSEPSP